MAEYKYIKEYLDTGVGTEGQLLLPRKIFDTLIGEVEKNLIPRSEAALYIGPSMIPGSSVDIDLETANSMDVRLVAEGAEVPLDQNSYTNINFKPLKYGVQLRITEEMIEDSKWPMLQYNIKSVGKRFAENETSLILTALDGAANTVSGGAAVTVGNIVSALLNLENSDFNGTTMLVGPEVLSDLRVIDTFAEADKFGNREMMEKGYVGRIYGLNVLKFSTNAAPSSTYSKYAYVYDKTQCYAIAEKRPVTLKGFKLEQYDMQGATVTQRIVVKLLRSSAVSNITSS